MPSRKSEFLRKIIRVLKPIFTRGSLEMQRMGTDRLSSIRRPSDKIKFKMAEVSGVPSEWFYPQTAPKDRAVLFLHGGAYVGGSLISSRVLAADIAYMANIQVLSIEYRLAPEHPFPAAIDDAIAAYQYILKSGISNQHIALCGDSAGGGLAFTTAMMLRDRGLPIPGAIVAMSPWADLTMSSESIDDEKQDPILSITNLKRAANQYAAGEDLKNPYISPVYGKFNDFPPTLIHVGSCEILLDDARQLEKVMLRDGAKVRLEVYEGMWHVWQLFNVPESNQALKEIGEFINRTLD